MVQHMDMCGNGMDGGALAEGVWEYVSDLVKEYHSMETRGHLGMHHNQVSWGNSCTFSLIDQAFVIHRSLLSR